MLSLEDSSEKNLTNVLSIKNTLAFMVKVLVNSFDLSVAYEGYCKTGNVVKANLSINTIKDQLVAIKKACDDLITKIDSEKKRTNTPQA